MNMNPAALHRYLRAHGAVWTRIGIYNRPKGDSMFSRWGERLWKGEH